MKFCILGYTKDQRTDTEVVYAQIGISEYLELVGEDFDRFEIQRKRQDPKKYTRLKEDTKKGALLPPITLAINPSKVSEFNETLKSKNSEKLKIDLIKSSDLYILDGLQRSYIIKDLIDEGVTFKTDQTLLIEIWFESKIEHLIYRLIVLNSGQKPMSMRHQVELLFTTLKTEIEETIPDLNIYVEKDSQIRSSAKKFSFDRIVNAYYSFLTKSPEVKRDNLIVQKLNEDDILSSNEEELNESYNHFINYLKKYCELDVKLFRAYSSEVKGPNFKNWLADENTLKGFFSAIGRYASDDKKRDRIDKALENLIQSFSDSIKDPLYLEKFAEIKSGIDPKRYNVGNETRRLIMDGFREFFFEGGESSFEECWKNSAR
ncbi:hypothetical protein [Cyclobacterium marinum]|uniref:Uncharacterized protein n=1 Tax=Cyclobacterium marinum (strain ATCC 25205 / DSM 745 / LMG 13164 / NCIMB 1802) TaxID=880070 RepID=G0J2I2_CYCMS|nr:hypothetical protein [Cyclobacterium marinum]AEL25873.1 hypothetical protein Cycma_2128 [Cyclobacterium marinum DSM 745]